MANTVKIKRSAVQGKIPSTGDLALGELALNTYDGDLFFKRDVSGTESIVTAATLNGSQTLTNKTISSAVVIGTLTAGNSVGTTGQILSSTGTGVEWVTSAGTSGSPYLDGGLITDPINTSAMVDGGSIA